MRGLGTLLLLASLALKQLAIVGGQETHLVTPPMRGGHVRATRFRPAVVVRHGCAESSMVDGSTCGYADRQWRVNDRNFEVVPSTSFSADPVRARVDKFQFFLLAYSTTFPSNNYDVFYSFGDVLAVPGPSAFENISVNEFKLKIVTIKSKTDSRYASAYLTHTYPFPGDYYVTAAVREKGAMSLSRISITKVTVVADKQPCQPVLHTDELGPCGRPAAFSAQRPVHLLVHSSVAPECTRPLVPRTDVQFVLLYAGKQGRPPQPQCGGASGPAVACARGNATDCTYRVTIDASCLRHGETAKVVLRQMWHRKTETLVEALAVGYLVATRGSVHASIAGQPIAYLSDVETLVLDGSGSRNIDSPGQPLTYRWACDRCDTRHSLYRAFVGRRLDQQDVQVEDELQYGPATTFEFVLHVTSAGESDAATIRVIVPGDRDDRMALSCPCCEFGVLSSESLILEARPQRTLSWGNRYPPVEWSVTELRSQMRTSLLNFTEQRGAVLLVPGGTLTMPGLYRFQASSWNQKPFVDIYYDLTRDFFERQGLREQTDQPPIKGRCFAGPEQGIAVRTIFRFECADFKDPEGKPLNYVFYFCHEPPGKLVDFAGSRPSPWHSCTLLKSALGDNIFTGVLPAASSKEAANYSVLVFVSDHVGQYVYDVVPVLVEVGSCSDVTLETAEGYARKSQQNSSDSILSFIKSSSIMLQSQFYRDCDRQTSGAVLSREAAIRDDYIEYLKNTSVETAGELQSSASVLHALVPQNVSAVTENFTTAAVQLIDEYTNTFDNLTSDSSQLKIADKTASIGGELIGGLTAILELKAPTPAEPPMEIPKKYETTPECATVEKLVHNIARVAAGVARVVDTEEKDVSISVEDYEVYIRETKRRGFLGTPDGTRVRINADTNGQTAIVFPSSPFRCHDTGKLTNTQAISVQATQSMDEVPLSVSTPLESFLKRNAPLDFEQHSGTYETSFSNASVHAINVTEGGVYLRLDFLPSDREKRLITAMATDRLPSRKDFLEQNRFHLYSNLPHESRMEFVPKPGVVMVAVVPLTKDAKAVLEDSYHKRRGDDDAENVTYTLRSSFYSCLFWNHTQQAYSSSGCRVLWDSDDQFVHCACHHNSIFAGGLFIAPHPIDFTNLGFLLRNMSSNLVMTIIVGTVWAIYFTVMVWAFGKDASDESAAGIEYLAENERDDSFGYLISVYTWFREGSSTTCRVRLKIRGSAGESRDVVLRDGFRNPLALQAGGRDWYFMSNPTNLGDIEAIEVTLELKGNNPSWYVSTIVVRDLQTASRTVFLVDDWLEPDEETGTATFTFEVAEESLIRNPWRIFTARIIRYFREEHLIFSIFSRLPTSKFTRKQRASVALLLVTTGMMVSLMFYGLDPDEEELFHPSMLYSLFEVPNRRELTIAVQSTLIVTPLVFLVVFLFEKSRPPAFRRKPAVRRVYVEDAVDEWVHDNSGSSVDSPRAQSVPKDLLNTRVREGIYPASVSAFAWFLCLLGAVAASTMTILYGLTYGYRRSLSWVRCNLINVIFSEFVISPLKLLCLSAIMACVLRAPVEMENIPVRFIE